MSENLNQIVNSFNLNSKFSQGVVESDRLLPSAHRVTQTQYLNTWRRVRDSGLDYGTSRHIFQLPETCRVISSIFLEIDLPALSGEKTYVQNVGCHIIKTLQIRSNSNVVYDVNHYSETLRDYLESLSTEAYAAFCDAYLGGDVLTNDARKVYIPLLIPNSHFLQREARSSVRGSGCFPCSFDRKKFEFQIELHPSTYVTTDRSAAGSILNAVSWSIREVVMRENDMLNYEKARGTYSINSRLFKKVDNGSDGWKINPAATQLQIKFNALDGIIPEIQLLAIATNGQTIANTPRDMRDLILPTSLRLICDGTVVREFSSQQEIKLELYKQGFVGNQTMKKCARLIFASHLASKTFTGGMVMDNISSLRIEATFGAEVFYQCLFSQLQNFTMDDSGKLSCVVK